MIREEELGGDRECSARKKKNREKLWGLPGAAGKAGRDKFQGPGAPGKGGEGFGEEAETGFWEWIRPWEGGQALDRWDPVDSPSLEAPSSSPERAGTVGMSLPLELGYSRSFPPESFQDSLKLHREVLAHPGPGSSFFFFFPCFSPL